MDIMWKSERLNIKQSVLQKLEQNIKNDDDLKMAEHKMDNKVYRELDKIRKILPGQKQFASILDNLPIKAQEVQTCVASLNKKINEHNQIFDQRKQQIEAKK